MGLQAVATKFATGTYTVTRRAPPSFTKGMATAGDSYDFPMTGSVQPVAGRELQDLGIGQQGKEVKVVYTEQELRGVYPSTVSPLSVAAESDDEVWTAAAHGKATGDGPYQVRGTLPTGISANTNYWVIVLDENTFQLAASHQDALDELPVSISTDGTGLTLVVTGNMTDTVSYKGEPWEVWKVEHWEAFGGNHWRAYIRRDVKP